MEGLKTLHLQSDRGFSTLTVSDKHAYAMCLPSLMHVGALVFKQDAAALLELPSLRFAASAWRNKLDATATSENQQFKQS